MKVVISYVDLALTAKTLGLTIKSDPSGYMVNKGDAQIFPGPHFPSQSKSRCAGFLLGVKWERENLREQLRPAVQENSRAVAS